MRSRWSSLVVCLALPGCAGVSGGLNEDTYPAEMAEHVCKRSLACECTQLNEIETQDDCELAATALYEAEREQALEAGASFDAECARETIDLMRMSSCDDLRNESQCRVCKPWVGTKLWGEDCETDWECGPRMRCMLFDFAITTRCGDPCESEQPFLQEGDACYFDAACDDDLWCDQRTDTCQFLPLIGEACEFGRCEAAGFCNLDNGTCEPDVGNGVPCSYVDQCAQGVCSTDDVQNPGACVPLPGDGEPCGPWGECGEDLTCDGGTCVPVEKLICAELERVSG